MLTCNRGLVGVRSIAAASVVVMSWMALADEPKAEPTKPATAVAADAPTESLAQPDSTPRIVVHADVKRESHDARVDYGEFKISRARFEVTSDTLTRAGGQGASAAEQKTAPASGASEVPSTGLIAVPSNTLSPGETATIAATGESLQQRSERAAIDRKIAEAEAREADAQAELARADAINTSDYGYQRGVPYYGGYYRFNGGYGYRRPGGHHRGPSVTVEHFANDRAIHEFADAARPNIGPAIHDMHEAQLRYGENARNDEIIPIQRGIDRAVIGDKLRREKVKPRSK